MGESVRRPYLVVEDILIIELYSRTPLAKIRRDNRDILDLSKFLTDHGCPRTPSAIKFKMENLKSVDKKYLDNGRRVGMTNISAQLSEVWGRFYNVGFADIDVEADKAREAIKSGNYAVVSPEEYFPDNSRVEGRTKKRVVNARVNQDAFRDRVLAAYENKCCVTGLDIPELLIASHIKPWHDCKGEESWQRMDIRNGLCLNALHDRAFDKGYMGIDEDMRVMYSPRIRDHYDRASISELFKPYEGRKIDGVSRVPAGKDYLEYHRKEVFVKS